LLVLFPTSFYKASIIGKTAKLGLLQFRSHGWK